MQLRYGTNSFAANSLNVASFTRALLNEAQAVYALRQRLTVTGFLIGTDQADLSAQESALRTTLSVPYLDLVLDLDSGAASATLLRNDTSISGVRVVEGPDFTGTTGAEYATQRAFSFTAEADYPAPGGQSALLAFEEAVTFAGGGPLYRVRRAVSGAPQRQLVYPATEFRAVQQGRAVGYLAYPPVPGPIWPGALAEAGEFVQVSPRRTGRGYEYFEVRWAYRFESVGALVGAPNRWP